MNAQPQHQHQWLHRLVGEWTSESECAMGPDQPVVNMTGTEVVRSLGGLWTVGEGTGGAAEDGWTSIMTLGFDPRTGRFVGSFIASMMTHQWIYDGALDATGKVLTLDTEGPDFSDGTITKYQDIIEFVDDDHRTLTSRMLGADGGWRQVMKAHYRRRA